MLFAVGLGVLWGFVPFEVGLNGDVICLFVFGACLVAAHHFGVTWSRSNHEGAWAGISVMSSVLWMASWSATAAWNNLELTWQEALVPTQWLELFFRPRLLGNIIAPELPALLIYGLICCAVPMVAVLFTRRATRSLRCPRHGLELRFVMVARFAPEQSAGLFELIRDMDLHAVTRLPLTDSTHAMRIVEIVRCPWCEQSCGVQVRSRYGIPGDGSRDGTKWYVDGGPFKLTMAQYELLDSLRPSVRPMSPVERAKRKQHSQDFLFGLLVGGAGLGLLKKSPTLYEDTSGEE